MSRNPLNDLSSSLGDYLRDQRKSARLSLRQLSELAGVSNPYLSQIERGLKRPSAEILQQLAKGLEVSAESLYVKAGILDEQLAPHGETPDVRRAIREDPALTARQKQALLDIYESYVDAEPVAPAMTAADAAPKVSRPRKAVSTATSSKTAKTSTTKKSSTTKSTPTSTATTKTSRPRTPRS